MNAWKWRLRHEVEKNYVFYQLAALLQHKSILKSTKDKLSNQRNPTNAHLTVSDLGADRTDPAKKLGEIGSLRLALNNSRKDKIQNNDII